MKKQIGILSATAIVAVALSACGGSADADTVSAKSMKSYTCEDLRDEAMDISKKEDDRILKVNGLKVFKDNRLRKSEATATKMWEPFVCTGNAIWSSGDMSPVRLILEVDVDGDIYFAYEG